MNDLELIDEHLIIRDTVGYEGIKDVDIIDIPEVMRFLRIVYNYQRMQRVIEKDNNKQTS